MKDDSIKKQVNSVINHFKEIKDLSVEKVTKKQLARGIKVDTKDDGIHIDVYCSFSYGINISETARKIQNAIYNSLSTMTTIIPNQINVHITHIVSTN